MVARTVAALLWATAASATPLQLQSYDDITGDTTASSRDFFGVVDHFDSGRDSDTQPGTVIHNAANGGAAGSSHSAHFACASTHPAYYSLNPTPTSTGTLTQGHSVHVATLPSAEYTIYSAIEGGGATGCQWKLQTDGTVKMYYRASLIGQSTQKLLAKVCCDANSTACDYRAPCSAGGDCTGQQCGAGTAPGACQSDGTGCYWPGLEFGEVVFSATQVECDLWWNGGHELTGTLTTTGASSLADLQYGCPAGETATTPPDIYLDDRALDDSLRAYHGYVDAATPSATGTGSKNPFNQTGCNPSDYQCIDDWASGAAYSGGTDVTTDNEFLATGAGVKTHESFWQSTPTIVPRAGETVTAVSVRLAGDTNSTNTAREMEASPCVCTAASACTCAPNVVLTPVFQQTPSYHIGEAVAASAPGGSAWDAAALALLGFQMGVTANNTASTKVGAALLQVRVTQPDLPTQITLKDRNSDGKVVNMTVGDSTNGFTLAATCPSGSPFAGELCTYNYYCPNIAPETKDKPVNGCTADADCQTCNNQASRDRSANGAGYSCASDSDCGTGTCGGAPASAGFCSNNVIVPCVANGDCTLGTCDFTAVCTATCGVGFTCPAHAAWGVYTTPGVDTNIRCSFGGQSSRNLQQDHWANVLTGSDASCAAEQGTGACACSSSNDCGACSVHKQTACSTTTDCTNAGLIGETCTAGTCAGGICTAGITARTACRDPVADCASGKACSFGAPDYIEVLEAYNDIAWSGGAPTCAGSVGANQRYVTSGPSTGPCATCAGTACLADSDCSGVAADSECAGSLQGFGSQFGCTDNGLFACTVYEPGCRSDATCLNGLTCKSQGSAYSQPNDWLILGFCQCGSDHTSDAADTQCVVDRNADGIHDTACRGHVCRRKCGRCSTHTTQLCAANGDCPGVETCSTSIDADCANGAGGCATTTPRVCKGACTCPSDSRKGCATDADCTSTSSDIAYFNYTWHGTCNAGSPNFCTCTGPNPCRVDTHCPSTFRDFEAAHDGHLAPLAAWHAMLNTANALANPPLVFFNQVPQVDSVAKECFGGYLKPWYFTLSNYHIGQELPAINADKAARRLPITTTHTDDVHHTATLAAAIGAADLQRLDTVGSCYTTDQYGELTPQRYCRNPNKSWTSTACTASAGCTPPATCQRRRCACSCNTSQDCVNWYGSGHTCVSGICKTGGTDSCTVYGASYVCSGGVCNDSGTDACPGSALCGGD